MKQETDSIKTKMLTVGVPTVQQGPKGAEGVQRRDVWNRGTSLSRRGRRIPLEADQAAEARLEVGPLAQLEQEEHRLPTWELVRRLEGVIRPPRGNWKHFSNVWGTDRSSCHA